MNIQVKFINEYVEMYKKYGDNMDIIEMNLEKLVKETENRWLTENAAIPIKSEDSLTWFRQNKGKQPMRGGTGEAGTGEAGTDEAGADQTDSSSVSGLVSGSVSGAVTGSVSGASTAGGAGTDTSASNYPSALLSDTNSIPVGYAKGNVRGDEVVEENYKWEKVAPIGGGSGENNSLLAFTEETKTAKEEADQSGGNETKKTIKFTL